MANLKIAVGCAALGCTLLSACQPQEPLSAYGTLERERIVLTAPATEIITGISATEGQRIEKGQPLLQLDHKLQQSKTDKAQAEVQRAAAALALLVQQLQGAPPRALGQNFKPD